MPHQFDYQAPKNLLTNKTILITGAGSGIGREIALSYASYGATTLLLGRSQAKLEAVYDEIVAAGNAEPVVIVLDLETANEDNYKQLAEMIDEHFEHIDGLVHNASVLGEMRVLQSYPTALFNSVMQVNVNASFALTKALLPSLQAAPSASILFTSSSVGRKGRAHWGAYAISKFATEGMMQVLADELANTSNIRVNSINPGATATQMRRSAYPAEDPATICQAAEIMGTYLYLMGEHGRNINGEAWDAQAPK